MKIPIKTLKSGFSLPVYGLGTARMGGLRGEMDTSRDSQEIEAIQAAIDYGVTHIDTAEVYGDGHTEEIVGRAIANFDRRKLFITTKVAPKLVSGRVVKQVNSLTFFPSSVTTS